MVGCIYEQLLITRESYCGRYLTHIHSDILCTCIAYDDNNNNDSRNNDNNKSWGRVKSNIY